MKAKIGNTAGDRWSAEDLRRISAHGLEAEAVERQLAFFRRGVPPVRLNRPCLVGNGIVEITETQRQDLLAAHEEARRTRRFVKFVPASGAASRMFRMWYRCLDTGGFADQEERAAFSPDLKRYAFFPDLQAVIASEGLDVERLIESRKETVVLDYILRERGLNYGRLPKALLKFHPYPEGNRTALEEHLVETALYARDSGNISRLHVTVSDEHEVAVREFLTGVIPHYESLLGTTFEVGISTQDRATHTLAVDPRNNPFRTSAGELVFRPGGHGSLLKNLNLIDGDIIFLKNIDNIVPDRLKAETVLWKKILAGYLIRLQDRIFAALRRLEDEGIAEEALDRICEFTGKEVNIDVPPGFRDLHPSERRSILLKRLNRPLRVCGMVKNEGEPGGGPFWVDDPDGKGGTSLQIVESQQIDGEDPRQSGIWSSATHFNPVDIVCGVRDFKGRKFDLSAFVDTDTATIVRKSEKGRELCALEWPGLWNGSMAFWNTVFIEVPLTTFNPVKTVEDLLRPEHL
jgi:hypothetical protein